MGLLKRLVLAIEKIANKKEDYAALERFLDSVIEKQAFYHHKARMEEMRVRYLELKSREKLNISLKESEKEEIKIWEEMFSETEKLTYPNNEHHTSGSQTT